MSNTRSMRLKANGNEYDEKLAEIERQARRLESFVDEVMAANMPSAKSDLTESIMLAEGGYEINFGYFLAQNRHANNSSSFEFRQGGERLSKGQWNLRVMRIFHNDLDFMIELAESVCAKAGRLEAFKAKLARFED